MQKGFYLRMVLHCALLSDLPGHYRAGRSTVSALLSTTTNWFSILEAGSEICAIFFDYRKPFDSVPHRPLLNKLISLNLDPFLLRWMANYLTARHQHVVVDGEKSTAVHVLSGVPHAGVCTGATSFSNLH